MCEFYIIMVILKDLGEGGEVGVHGITGGLWL